MVDLTGVEQALVVIAVTLAIQTVVVTGAAIAAWIATRRASATLERELHDLRAKTDEVAAAVQRAAAAVGRGTEAMHGVVDDARQAVQSVSAITGTMATAIAAPRAAAAYGVVRGMQWWRARREAKRRRDGADIDA